MGQHIALLVAVAVLATVTSGVHASTPAQTELAALESTLQPFVGQISLKTEIEDVWAVMGADYGMNQPCSSTCARHYYMSGGEQVSWLVRFSQFSETLNSENYQYDRPFETDAFRFEVELRHISDAPLCFSMTSWNAALILDGWEPLRPFASIHEVDVTDDPNVYESGDFENFKKTMFTARGYVSRRGDTYVMLTNAGSNVMHAAPNLSKSIDAIVALGDCPRVMTVDLHMGKAAWEIATGPPATSTQ